MKDIMKKLAELEATAPKVSKKKMLKEDSTTPPMNAETKPTRLKDIFETMATAQPVPVVGKQGDTQQTGAGFINVTDNSPAAQALSKAVGDLAGQKKLQIVVPNKPGQPGQAGTTPAPAGATGQPQAGQQPMREKWGTDTKVAPSEKGKYAGKDKAELTKAYNKLKASGPHKKGSPEFGKMRELAFAIRAKSDWGKVQEEDMDEGAGAKDWHDDMEQWALNKGLKNTGGKSSLERAADRDKDWALSHRKSDTVKEGAKVDRMVKHIEKSERKLGKSKEKASDIAWATVNKRGMLDNKNKKKIKEVEQPTIDNMTAMGAGLGAGRSQTTLEAKEPQVEVIDNAFNRENYKDLIGKKYPKSKAPAYARVKEISEGAKPDFLDLDKDGNKKESMKKAAADKKKQKVKESMNHRISAARLEGKSHGLRGHAHSGKRYEDLEELKAYHEGYIDGLNECYGQGVYEGVLGTLGGAALGGMLGGPVGAAIGAVGGQEMTKGGSAVFDETAPKTPPATVPGMANAAMPTMEDEMEEGKLGKAALALGGAAALATGAGVGKNIYDYHKKDASGYSQSDVDKMMGTDSRRSAYDREQERRGNYRFEEDEMEEGNAFTGALAKTKKGDKFSVGGKTFTDTSSLEEYAFEAWDRELSNLLNESEEVTEGMSVSISKGQQNSPDSVTITAQDQEADELLAFVKQAGLGLFGGDKEPSQAMSIQPTHGAPDEVGAGGVDIDVVDGDDMLSLMKKISGVEAAGANDYADEEGHEGCADCGQADCGCDDKEQVEEVESEDQMEYEVAEDNAPDSETAEHNADEEAEAEEDSALAKAAQQNKTTTVNEGGDGGEASEEGPESKEGETDEEGETVSESFANLFRKLDMIAEESTEKKDEKAEKAGKKVTKDIEYDDKKDKKEKVDESEQLDEIFGFGKKSANNSNVQGNQHHLIDFARKYGAGDIKPDAHGQMNFKLDIGSQKGLTSGQIDIMATPMTSDGKASATVAYSPNSAHKPGQRVVFDFTDPLFPQKFDRELGDAIRADYARGQKTVNEWANQVGKGPGKGTDASFEQDIEFMTKVIAGGLNKPKSTGQTTIPVIAGQEDRMHDNPQDWATLAGIKK